MRETIGDNFLRWLPGDVGAVAAGILIGGGEWLSFGAKQDLARVGLLHVVAASGYNVTVVVGWLLAVGIKTVGRSWGLVLAVVGVVGYMWLAGWSASVVRAGIMGILVLGAQAVGRQSEAKWLLGLTAFGMVVVRPEYLIDVGWQLSVAATGGLIWIRPEIEKWWSGGGWFGENIRTSMAAQVAVAPIILHYFGNFSAVSPIVNAVVLWTIPMAMQIAAVAAMVGLVWPVGGQIVALGVWPFIAWFLGVGRWVAGQVWSGWDVGRLGWGWVATYYLVVGIWLFRGRRSEDS